MNMKMNMKMGWFMKIIIKPEYKDFIETLSGRQLKKLFKTLYYFIETKQIKPLPKKLQSIFLLFINDLKKQSKITKKRVYAVEKCSKKRWENKKMANNIVENSKKCQMQFDKKTANSKCYVPKITDKVNAILSNMEEI